LTEQLNAPEKGLEQSREFLLTVFLDMKYVLYVSLLVTFGQVAIWCADNQSSFRRETGSGSIHETVPMVEMLKVFKVDNRVERARKVRVFTQVLNVSFEKLQVRTPIIFLGFSQGVIRNVHRDNF